MSNTVKKIALNLNLVQSTKLEVVIFNWVETKISSMLLLTWLVWFANKKVNIDVLLSSLFFYFNSVFSYHILEGTINSNSLKKDII
jgi:hypothetical protein